MKKGAVFSSFFLLYNFCKLKKVDYNITERFFIRMCI